MKEIGKSNSPLLIFIIYFEGRNLLKTDSPVPTCIGEIGNSGTGMQRNANGCLATIGNFCYNLLLTSRIFPWEKYDDNFGNSVKVVIISKIRRKAL